MTTRFTVEAGLLPAIEAARDRGLEAVAEFAADEARRHAPVATGELRASIHVEQDADGTSHVVADSDHAAFVEFGTRKMRAEPFVTPGALNAQARGEQLIARAAG